MEILLLEHHMSKWSLDSSDSDVNKIRPSILIVDDEKDVRDHLSSYLSRDFLIHTACDGCEALEKVGDNPGISVILSDLKMPRMDGLQLLEQVQKERRNIATILITGSASVKTAIDAMRLGAHDYMRKPVDLNRLESSIRSALINKGLTY